MSKKEYQKPSFKEFEMESIQLLAGSYEGPGDGGSSIGDGEGDSL